MGLGRVVLGGAGELVTVEQAGVLLDHRGDLLVEIEDPRLGVLGREPEPAGPLALAGDLFAQPMGGRRQRVALLLPARERDLDLGQRGADLLARVGERLDALLELDRLALELGGPLAQIPSSCSSSRRSPWRCSRVASISARPRDSCSSCGCSRTRASSIDATSGWRDLGLLGLEHLGLAQPHGRARPRRAARPALGGAVAPARGSARARRRSRWSSPISRFCCSSAESIASREPPTTTPLGSMRSPSRVTKVCGIRAPAGSWRRS